MSTSITLLGMEVWEYVVLRWTVPTKFKNKEMMIKPELEWKCEERKAASRNFTTLHVIQCGMNDKKFILIASSEFAKET